MNVTASTPTADPPGQPLTPDQPTPLGRFDAETRPATGTASGNGIGTAAGILGIGAVVPFFLQLASNPLDGGLPTLALLLAPIVGVAATVLGLIGIHRAKARGGASKRMAITGLVCGPIGVVISMWLIAVLANYYALVAG